MKVIGENWFAVDIPSVDKMLNENSRGLISTPEGRLIISVFIQALEDLDYELQEGYPLETLDWFMGESPMLYIACWMLEWNVDSLRVKIHKRIKEGRILNKKVKKDSKNENNA